MPVPAAAVTRPRASLESALEEVARAVGYHDWLASALAADLIPPVLEIGSGLGTLALALGRHIQPVLASEPDADLARRLQERCRNHPQVIVVPGVYLPAEIPPLPLSPRSVIIANVLEHIGDDVAALRAVRETIPSLERLSLVVPAHRWAYSPLDARLGHHRRYDKPELERVLEVSGWASRKMRYFNPAGAVAWTLSGRLFRRERIAPWQTEAIERLLPVLKVVDRSLRGRFLGQSLIAVAER